MSNTVAISHLTWRQNKRWVVHQIYTERLWRFKLQRNLWARLCLVCWRFQSGRGSGRGAKTDIVPRRAGRRVSTLRLAFAGERAVNFTKSITTGELESHIRFANVCNTRSQHVVTFRNIARRDIYTNRGEKYFVRCSRTHLVFSCISEIICGE